MASVTTMTPGASNSVSVVGSMTAQTNHAGKAVTFRPKKCPNGHICTVQAKKCSTCGARCVSMSKSAVQARLRRQKRRTGKPVKLKRATGKRKRGAQKNAGGTKKQTTGSKDLARINLVKGAHARVGKRAVTIVSTTGTTIHFRYADDGSQGKKSAKDVRAMCVLFTDEHGNDVEMDTKTSWTILEAYSARKADVSYGVGSQSYKLVFNGLRAAQTNVDTNVTRPVFLRKIKAAPKVAPLFSVKPTPLSALPADLQSIIRKQRFLSKCEIYDLQPWLRGDQIVALQQHIQKEHGNPSDLTWAWHGTSIAGAQNIAVAGFQDAGTANAKCYGSGPYLSIDPSYSLGYCVPDAHKRHVMFACHTLLGNREATGSNVRMLSSHTVRSGGQSSGHLVMKPWVYAHTDINIAYAVVFKK